MSDVDYAGVDGVIDADVLPTREAPTWDGDV